MSLLCSEDLVTFGSVSRILLTLCAVALENRQHLPICTDAQIGTLVVSNASSPVSVHLLIPWVLAVFLSSFLLFPPGPCRFYCHLT